MPLSVTAVATAALPAYLAIKYRVRWFDSSAPDIRGAAAGVSTAMAAWALWIAPDTCGTDTIRWSGAQEMVVMAAAAVPLVAGNAIRAHGGPAAVAVYVAAQMVRWTGGQNECTAVAIAIAAAVVAATVISAGVDAMKQTWPVKT